MVSCIGWGVTLVGIRGKIGSVEGEGLEELAITMNVQIIIQRQRLGSSRYTVYIALSCARPFRVGAGGGIGIGFGIPHTMQL